ncbi:MAG: T9SS type A sorting domain-containing protein [Erysipelotrichia bacterium]|nr:T9SS type A sorting domain-containing protein [Erysipelotrichia bacterium]
MSGALNGGGLSMFDNCSWTVYQNPNAELSNNDFTIWSIAIDEDNIKWIGTNEFSPDAEGLVSFDDENWLNYNTQNSDIPDYIVREVQIDIFNNIWVGTYSGGLAKFDGDIWTIYNTTNSDLPSNMINSIFTEANGDLWVGTVNGLAHFDGLIWTIYNTDNSGLPSNNIRVISKDLFGLWFGTSNGLVKYHAPDWTVYNTDNSELPSNFINDIKIESSVVKWIATWEGLVRFMSTSTTVYNYNNSDLPTNYINTISIDEYGNKWIGTYNGLAVFNDQGVVIPCQEYCPGNQVLDTIYTETIESHISSYFESQNCWDDLTEFFEDAIFPSGLDVAIVISEIVGLPNSIVDHYTLEPINEGDTLYLIENDISQAISLRHLDYSALTYQILLIGNPTEFNQTYNCNYTVENVIYTADCISFGRRIEGEGSCYTCNPTHFTENPAEKEVSIYPNPTNSTFEIKGTINGKVELMNLHGQVIRIISASDENSLIDISELTSGLYFLRFQTKSGFETKKIVKY